MVPRHDRDAGGPADVLAAKATLRQEIWDTMRAAKVARFPGAAGRIPNFTGAEAAAGRLRTLAAWEAARTLKSNPDSAQLPVRQRALEDGKTVYMAVPRLAQAEPFFALDPDHLSEPPRRAASISGAARSARRVTIGELSTMDLVVMGCVAAGEDGARLGKGGGFADLEYALATAAGLIGPDTVCVTTVHELQVRPSGTIPLTSHDIGVDFIVTPERVIDCRQRLGPRPPARISWDDLTEEKIAAIPLLSAQRSLERLPEAMLVTGIDGCRGGWVAVTLRDGGFAGVHYGNSLHDVVTEPGVVGIDMPLGFAQSGWRECDRLARRLLGPRRASVFSIPPRVVWACDSHAEASQLCREITGQGLSVQAWGLRVKLLEANVFRSARDDLFEVHPELAFAALAGQPLAVSKHSPAGLGLRRWLLGAAGIAVPDDARGGDVLDAAAVAWSALRIALGTATVLPDPPDQDVNGLDIAIRY